MIRLQVAANLSTFNLSNIQQVKVRWLLDYPNINVLTTQEFGPTMLPA